MSKKPRTIQRPQHASIIKNVAMRYSIKILVSSFSSFCILLINIPQFLTNRDNYIKVIELSGSSMYPPNKPSLKTISPSIFSPVISKRAVWYRDIALSFVASQLVYMISASPKGFVAHNSIKLVSNSLLKPFP